MNKWKTFIFFLTLLIPIFSLESAQFLKWRASTVLNGNLLYLTLLLYNDILSFWLSFGQGSYTFICVFVFMSYLGGRCGRPKGFSLPDRLTGLVGNLPDCGPRTKKLRGVHMVGGDNSIRDEKTWIEWSFFVFEPHIVLRTDSPFVRADASDKHVFEMKKRRLQSHLV